MENKILFEMPITNLPRFILISNILYINKFFVRVLYITELNKTIMYTAAISILPDIINCLQGSIALWSLD